MDMMMRLSVLVCLAGTVDIHLFLASFDTSQKPSQEGPHTGICCILHTVAVQFSPMLCFKAFLNHRFYFIFFIYFTN